MKNPTKKFENLALDKIQIGEYTLDDYWKAGSSGPLEYTWKDKPHRLMYDLIRHIAELPPEFCICAAIRMPDGEIIHGHRHSHCFNVVRAQPNKVREDLVKADQGFVTSTGRFVGRREAMEIQKSSGIPSCGNASGQYHGDELFSEDLY